MIRCVALDLDGVVIPSEPSFKLFETTYGITRRHWEQFFVGSYQQAMLGEVALFQILSDLLREWRWTATTEEFADVWIVRRQNNSDRRADLLRDGFQVIPLQS